MSWIALVFLAAAAAPSAPHPCSGERRALVVETGMHRLWRCEDGRSVEELAVALGSGGVGKRREGDGKVPVGEYTLGAPLPSNRYRIFIPVGYPTAEQWRAGFTGSAIGVHGPARGYETLGAANTAVDWTLGCIAVGSDPEIERIAAWVKAKAVSRIVIH